MAEMGRGVWAGAVSWDVGVGVGVAERVGFEPTRDLRPYTLSRRA